MFERQSAVQWRGVFHRLSRHWITILCMAVALAFVSVSFGVVHAVIWRDLPVRDQDQLAWITMAGQAQNRPLPYVAYEYLREIDPQIDVAAISTRHVNVSGPSSPERLRAEIVSHNFFTTLGVQPVIGRPFQKSDEDVLAGSICVISDALRKRWFGGDESVVGRTINVNELATTIIGVMPPGFRYWRDDPTDLWALFHNSPTIVAPAELTNPGYRTTTLVARLDEPGEAEGIQNSVSQILRELGSSSREEGDPNVSVVSLGTSIEDAKASRVARLQLFVAVLVFTIALANVANMIAQTAISRQSEMAIRSALGATSFRLCAAIAKESLAVATTAAVLGLLLCAALTRLIQATYVTILPDRSVSVWLPFLLCASLACVSFLVVSLLTYWPLFRSAPAMALSPGRIHGGSRQSKRGRLLLVALQALLGTVIATYSIAAISTVERVSRVDWGFSNSDTLSIKMSLAGSLPLAERTVIYGQLSNLVKDQLQARAVALASDLPTPNDAQTVSISFADGRRILNSSEDSTPGRHYVSPEFFRALQIPLVEGRLFSDLDRVAQRRVVVVDQVFARQYWPHDEAVGQQIRFERREPWFEVVGVVGSVRFGGPSSEFKPEVYVPYSVAPFLDYYLLVDSEYDNGSILDTVRRAVAYVAPGSPIFDIATLDDRIALSSSDIRFTSVIATLLATTGLIIALCGVHAFVAFSVSARKYEMGIRYALGAGLGHALYVQLSPTLVALVGGVSVGAWAVVFISDGMSVLFSGIGVESIRSLAPGVAVFILSSGLSIAGISTMLVGPIVAPHKLLHDDA